MDETEITLTVGYGIGTDSQSNEYHMTIDGERVFPGEEDVETK